MACPLEAIVQSLHMFIIVTTDQLKAGFCLAPSQYVKSDLKVCNENYAVRRIFKCTELLVLRAVLCPVCEIPEPGFTL
jgi:hypothetical protein